MIIKRGATTPLLFPVVDKDDIPIDLREVDLCFILKGGGTTIQKSPGDDGCTITGYSGAEHNALSVILSSTETKALKTGSIYTYWLWLDGADGKTPIASGNATVTNTEMCTEV